MNKKLRVLIILGVLCLAIIGYLAVNAVVSKDSEEETGIVLSSVNVEDIISFSYQHHDDEEYDDQLYNFICDKGVWYYEPDKAFPVSQNMASAKAQVISKVTAQRVVEENPSDLAAYGLDKPYLTVTLSDKDDTYTYFVGDYNASTTTYYITQEGSNTVYLADADLFLAFDVQIWDMMQKQEVSIPDYESYTKVAIKNNQYNIVLKKDKLEADYIKEEWYLLDSDSQIVPNTDKIETAQYPKLISGLTFLRQVDYYCDEEDFKSYGFNNPSLIITIDYEDAGKLKQFVLTVGKQTTENSIYEDFYCLTSESNAVFTITYESLEKLNTIDKNSLVK